jgi:hypothetical protein
MTDRLKEKPDHEKDGGEGHHAFGFTYDDTGETAQIEAPNGWTLQRVIDEAYEELRETAKPDDRVEFTAQQGAAVMTPELRAMKVKDFLERRLSTDNQFHIVSKPGGALS